MFTGKSRDAGLRQAGGPGSPVVTVAASNAPQSWKDAAGYRCDGKNDDAVLAAAMAEASGAAGTSGTFVGHAEVLLSPGTFKVKVPLEVVSRVWLRGSGRGATMVRAQSGHRAVGSSSSGVVTMSDPAGDPYDLRTLSDLTIHGGSLDVNGFYSRFTQSAASKDDDNLSGQPDAATVLERLVVASCGREGVHISSAQASTSWWLDKIRVWSCGDSGNYPGFNIAGTDCWVSNCDVGSQGRSGADAVGFQCGGSDNFYVNCIAWTTKGSGFVVSGSKQMLSNCLSHHSEKHGFRVTNNRNTLANCIAYNNAGDGFRTESNNITITGCMSFDDKDSFSVPGRPQSTGYNIASGGRTAGINIVGSSAFGPGLVPVAGRVADPTNNIQVTWTGDNQNGSSGTREVVVWRDGLFEGSGAGSPEGVVVAPVGSTYRRRDGSAGSVLYVKETGAGSSGWKPVGGGSGSGSGAAVGGGSNLLVVDRAEDVPKDTPERTVVVVLSPAGGDTEEPERPAEPVGPMEPVGPTEPVAPVVAGFTTAAGSAGSLSIDKPSDLVDGDMLLLLVCSQTRTSTVTLTPPPGFSRAGWTEPVANDSARYNYAVVKRVTDAGSEPASYPFLLNNNGTSRVTAVMLVLRGAAAVPVAADPVSAEVSTEPELPQVVVPGGAHLLVGMIHTTNTASAGTEVTAAPGWSVVVSVVHPEGREASVSTNRLTVLTRTADAGVVGPTVCAVDGSVAADASAVLVVAP